MIKSIKKQTPELEPITLEEARLHLRLDVDLEGSPATHPDDDLVQALITVAREQAENYTGQIFASTTATLALDEFPARSIDLTVWPVQSITSVQYQDSNGDPQTLSEDDYLLDDFTQPARLHPVDAFPATDGTVNNIIVIMEVGCTNGQSPDDYPIPLAVKQAMLLMIGHLYSNRRDVTSTAMNELPMGSIHLLTPYRINMGM